MGRSTDRRVRGEGILWYNVPEITAKESTMDASRTGELIAARRRELGLSQEELAERLHVTDKAVSKWENGRGMPGIESLEPLAEALDLSVSELLSGRRLTAEELPKAAGGQIVESMQERVRLLRGFLATLVMIAALAGIFLGYHYFDSAPETDLEALTKQAAAYLGRHERWEWEVDYDALEIVETERRGDYLAALCTDGAGNWCMCEYDRDRVFPSRWRAGGGNPSLGAGELGSWNFGTGGDAVIIFCGGDLPAQAASYTFWNSGITYICPIENRQVLDVFLLPDTANIADHHLELLDENGQPLDWPVEGTVGAGALAFSN